ncbi:MAG: lamin tail domain-containing protein [Anaerolineales bacterium]|nr:lamin tail domain-containing protein [Anaerolineales bacterium]
MNFRRLLVYLLLNAIVSASATYAVLWYWDRQHPAGPAIIVPSGTAVAATQQAAGTGLAPLPTAGPTFTLPPAGETAAAGPTPTIYIAQEGDTLGKIAQEFGVTVDAILAANGLTDPNVLTVGQNLIIPVEGYVPPTVTPGAASAEPTSTAEPPRATVTSDPNQAAAHLTITEVRGAGALADEAVLIRNDGGQVDLAGWTLRDEMGSLYTFPALTLGPGAVVALHTAAGADTATDLHWGLAAAVWAGGRSVLLSDATGNLHTRYTLP